MMVEYVRALEARMTDTPLYGRTVSGYGAKIPTRYMVRTDQGGRWRRVYMAQYGNSGSAYVIVTGAALYLDTDSQYLCMSAPDNGQAVGYGE